MELVYIRHGEIPSMQNKEELINVWKNSQRYMDNYMDEPLTDKGLQDSFQVGKRLLQIIDIDNYKYIYSSPFEQCIMTSIQIINAINKETGKKLKIRIEYGLHKTLRLDNKSYITFDNGKMKENYPDIYYKKSQNKYITSIIDDVLYFDNLIKKYGEYIDKSYVSFVSEKKYEKIPKSKQSISYLIDTLQNIIKNNKYIMIVSNGGYNYIYPYYYLTKNPFDERKYFDLFNRSSCPYFSNFVSLFKKKTKSKSNKWKCLIKPTNILKN